MHGSIDSGSTIIDLYIVTILATLLLVKRQCMIRKYQQYIFHAEVPQRCGC